MFPKSRIIFPFLAMLMLTSSALAGCASAPAHDAQHEMTMAPLADMPMDVQQAPIRVQEAYQFAVANPDVLNEIPCYCGCGAIGHLSAYDCYVASTLSDGSFTYEPHALGCSICVDITQDTMRLLKEGQTVADIRLYIDTTYAKFGPSTMP